MCGDIAKPTKITTRPPGTIRSQPLCQGEAHRPVERLTIPKRSIVANSPFRTCQFGRVETSRAGINWRAYCGDEGMMMPPCPRQRVEARSHAIQKIRADDWNPPPCPRQRVAARSHATHAVHHSRIRVRRRLRKVIRCPVLHSEPFRRQKKPLECVVLPILWRCP